MTTWVCDESAYILMSIVSLKPYFTKFLIHKPKKKKFPYVTNFIQSFESLQKSLKKQQNYEIYHVNISINHIIN